MSDLIDMAMIMPQYPIPNYKDGGIHIKKKNRGKFNALKKRTGKTTEELTHSKNPLTHARELSLLRMLRNGNIKEERKNNLIIYNYGKRNIKRFRNL